MNELLLLDLGRTDYDEVLKLQGRLVEKKLGGFSSDFLITTEHNPVITLGVSSEEHMLKLSRDEYQKLGIQIREIKRGGKTTYHGPGQIIIYPIINLEAKYGGSEVYHKRVLRNMLKYENEAVLAMIKTVCLYEPFNETNVLAKSSENKLGVWHKNNGAEFKIGARGIEVVKNKITKHGFVLNVTTQSFNHLIKPCGHEQDVSKCMQDFAKQELEYAKVKEQLIQNFAETLNYTIRKIMPEEIDRI